MIASCAGVVLFLGGGGTPNNGLYGEAPPERDTFFSLQVYKRAGISQVEVCKRVWKLVIWAFKGAFSYNNSNRGLIWLYQFIQYMKMRTRLPKVSPQTASPYGLFRDLLSNS